MQNQSGKFKFFSSCGMSSIYVYGQDFDIFKIRNLKSYAIYLDDRVFKRSNLSIFEKILRTSFHAYFFNQKNDLHYDQFEIYTGQTSRVLCSCPLRVEASRAKIVPYFLRTMPFHARLIDGFGLRGDFLVSLPQETVQNAELKFMTYIAACKRIKGCD